MLLTVINFTHPFQCGVDRHIDVLVDQLGEWTCHRILREVGPCRTNTILQLFNVILQLISVYKQQRIYQRAYNKIWLNNKNHEVCKLASVS